MGKLGNIGKAVIRINVRDHHPAHFHVIAPDFEALVTIDPVAIYRGSMPASIWAVVAPWAVANRALVVAEWNRCNPSLPIV